MKRLQRAAAVSIAVLFMSACASTGLAPAQTFNEKLAYAYGVDTTILQATAQGVMAGSLSSSDAQKILADSDSAKHTLDAAAAIASTDPAGANSKLAIAVAALTAIQDYLSTHKRTSTNATRHPSVAAADHRDPEPRANLSADLERQSAEPGYLA